LIGVSPTPPNEPYTTYEYSRGRIHLLPDSHALNDPYHADQRDWSLSARPGGDTVPWFPGIASPKLDVPATTSRAAEAANVEQQFLEIVYPKFVKNVLWWPAEHYDSPRKISQLPVGVLAMLRRQSGGVLAVAYPTDSLPLGAARSGVSSGFLMVARDPATVRQVATTKVVAGESLVLFGDISPEPAVVGVEVRRNDRNDDAMRTRFGIVPPDPLSALHAGEVAISDLILLHAGSETTLPTQIDSALRVMMPTNRLPRGASVGVYWETYGIAPGDSVEITARIARRTAQGLLRRLGAEFHLASDLNTPVSVMWSEGKTTRGMNVGAGSVPAIARSVVLDSSKLPTGEYSLILTVKRGQQTLTADKSFVIQ
jgi:hypothetical protein